LNGPGVQNSRLRLVVGHWSLVIAVALLAAWLRFSHLDRAEFQWDQAEISKWALNLARQGQFSWIGPISSTGIDTFPVAIWLWAIPYAISSSPVFATGFLAAINLLAVIGYYFLVRRWFGRTAALVTILLFAVAPWAVIYSRKIWHTTLLPPLVLPYVVTGWLAFVRGRRWALVAHGLALALLVQTHFAALPFVLLTGLWALVFRRRLGWRIVSLAALVAVLTFVPYFAHDARQSWHNVQRFLVLVRQPATLSADAAHATWVASTGQGLYWLIGPDRYADFVAGAPNLRALFVIEGGLAIAGGALALWRAARQARAGLDDETATALMAATWLVMPALFLTRHNTVVAPHYFTTTFPAQFILVGWLVSGLVRWLEGRAGVKAALAMLVVAIAAAQVREVTSLLHFVMTHEVRGYGTPVRYEIEAVQTALRLGEDISSAEVTLLSEGDEPRMYEMPNVADILLYGQPHRAVDVRTALVFPADPAVYWATYEMTPGEMLLAQFTPEIADARIPLREGVRSFRFYRWPGGEPPIPNLQLLPGGPRRWANGAQLVGYILEGDLRPGGTLRWTLVWRTDKTPTEDIYYHWFNHLLDGQGQLRAQQDGPSVLPASWRAGDTILNWFALQVPVDAPPGDYTMRVGLYAVQPGSGALLGNVQVLGTDGAPAGEWIEVGLFQTE
jgi:4-amino-4-deoxy-L-arabinose transferase-like glycosyltransferase